MVQSDNRSTVRQQGTSARFESTHWSVILQAADSSAPGADDALNQFCQTYWFPVYAFLRGKGNDYHAASDLTQGFFAHLLQKNLLKKAGPGRGRFRSFLLACLTNYSKDEWRKCSAQKRGGACTISVDEGEAEQLYGGLPVQVPDLAMKFDAAWAATVIKKAKCRLKGHGARKADVYQALEGCLTGELTPDSYAAVASRLAMSRATLHVTVSRFRSEFGRLLRDEVSKTVGGPAEVDDELKYLVSAWASCSDTRTGT